MKKQPNKLKFEFLPSALEIIETPPSPIGWLTIWLIFIFIMLSIAWAIVGQVDEVAIARGTVIPDGRVKVIQSAESGMILNLPVKEGERIKKGQLLVELDNTMAGIDMNATSSSLNQLKVEKKILESELSGSDPATSNVGMKDANGSVANFKNFRQQAKDNLKRRTEALQDQVSQTTKEIEFAVTQIDSSNKRIDFLKKELSKLKELNLAGAVSSNEVDTKQAELNVLIEELKGLAIKKQKAQELEKTSREAVENEKKRYYEELMSLIVQKDKEILEASSQFKKAKTISGFNKIVSPVSGQISGLGNNAVGSVISASNPIMTIVPDKTPLVIEAVVMNQDIGFIMEGQKVDIKVDTFPFQKYGVIEGVISFVSPDAFQDEKMGSVYKIRVNPEKEGLQVNQKFMKLSSGMTTTVEVKTGKRRIIEFFIPAIDYIKESFELR